MYVLNTKYFSNRLFVWWKQKILFNLNEIFRYNGDFVGNINNFFFNKAFFECKK